MTVARAQQLADDIAGKRGDLMTRVGKTPPGTGVVLVTDPRVGIIVLFQENHAELFYKRRRLGPVPKEARR